MKYSFDSSIRFSETKEDEKLSYTSIVNYFQDCSNFQSKALGLGADTLAAKHRAWVLLGWQIEINRRPEVGEKVQITTWPYGFRGFYGNRNYTMVTDKGECLAYANSIWVYLDADNQVPTKIDDEELNGYKLEDKLDMQYAPRKVEAPADYREREAFVVKRTHLDVYHHVNNGQYIAMAEPFLPSYFEVEQLRIEYRKQATLGKRIIPCVSEVADKVTVALCDETKVPYAVIEFTARKGKRRETHD